MSFQIVSTAQLYLGTYARQIGVGAFLVQFHEIRNSPGEDNILHTDLY